MIHFFKFSILLASFLACFSCQKEAAQSFEGYEWQTLSCVGEPVERHEAAFIEANGKFYLMGGRRIQEVSIFDPQKNTWTSGAKPPLELHHFQGFSFKGQIYVVGVQSGKYPREQSLGETYMYDPANDVWEKGFNMPSDRVRGSTTASVYKDKLYIAGGIIDGHWDGHVRWFDCYDFNTAQWEILPDAPRFRDHACTVVCNNKLYLLGGRVTSGNIKKVFELTIPEVDVFDFKTEKWSTLEMPLPTPRAGCTAVAIHDKILFAGGESATQAEAHAELECLDTKTGIWSSLPSLKQGRHGTQLIWSSNRLYIASGCGKRGGNPELKSIERFSNTTIK